MSYKVRVVVEKVDTRTGKVVDRDSNAEHKLINPRDITDLGLRHKVQIQILKHLQQYILNEQVAIISNDTGACKYCGGALNKIGYKESNFHAVFTDHKLKVQRNICTLCNKRSIPSRDHFKVWGHATLVLSSTILLLFALNPGYHFVK